MAGGTAECWSDGAFAHLVNMRFGLFPGREGNLQIAQKNPGGRAQVLVPGRGRRDTWLDCSMTKLPNQLSHGFEGGGGALVSR
jgi:hypothetical protein